MASTANERHRRVSAVGVDRVDFIGYRRCRWRRRSRCRHALSTAASEVVDTDGPGVDAGSERGADPVGPHLTGGPDLAALPSGVETAHVDVAPLNPTGRGRRYR